MLQDNLEYQIHKQVQETCRDCNLILCHPKTWEDLIKETSLLYDNYVDSTFIKYRGIRVYRSLDVIEGIFEVK